MNTGLNAAEPKDMNSEINAAKPADHSTVILSESMQIWYVEVSLPRSIVDRTPEKHKYS